LNHPRRTLTLMSLPLPNSLSPSKVSSFKDCALAFRFSAIERIPEPPSEATSKGTLVHLALERLHWSHSPPERTLEVALAELDDAWGEFQVDGDFTGLALSDSQVEAFRLDAELLVRRYFELEDPRAVTAVGVELTLDAEVSGLRLRGIIDRLDVTSDGGLIVVDYKTGRVPHETQEQSRLGGVQFYALLCEQVLGKRPDLVRLLYLREPVAIEAIPSDQALRGLRQRTSAIWSAIERACENEDFRPKPSALCNWCNFKTWCPVYGGDPALAKSECGATESAVDGAKALATA